MFLESKTILDLRGEVQIVYACLFPNGLFIGLQTLVLVSYQILYAG